MKVMAPRFWHVPHATFQQRLLTPFSLIVRFAHKIRQSLARPLTVSVPVICCGNLSVGGTGKTIVVRELTQRLQAQGHTPHILSRGYRARLKGPLRIDVEIMTSREAGDEPIMLARDAPVWIGRDRRQTALAAIGAGADCLIMDDGLQNPGLAKTLRIVIIDGAVGLGNRHVIPAGPLREDAERGLMKADAVILIGEDKTSLAAKIPPGKTILRAQLIPGTDLRRLQGQRVIAFAGIGRPSKFFSMLTDSGITASREISFPDHHDYTDRDCQRLIGLSQTAKMQLVTTAKDAVKLPAWFREQVQVIHVALKWDRPEAVERLLKQVWKH
ncbi:tetraacyldisaccharide 4'-kinase [Candidatus Kirkpatrickella diaphorinae]|uniref:Tetraacyldisaccharide 4'-kinase n=1 Tax=Candidatus Kirkpatrickella diaphorinae TaxID=2984322 RepID=A0ABY6GMA3_9PROT|nr:tetraacyldisaccharide 4'-kinase [Candidatus Kirkpatrickella diaphorinae]UYH52060.1 tetraacyldisaccharide 4'-kinase [Candidatus Kirkpatrickella diaphorinae]